MRHELTLAVAALALTGLIGCGDDDVTPATDLGVHADLGPADLGVDTDAGPTDAGPSFSIADPATAHYGKTYAEWASEWWKWVYGATWTANPLNDTTGANCRTGQDPAVDGGVSREVFFLGGTFGGDATRACTIPAGKALFVPLYNYLADNCGVALADQMTTPELQSYITTNLDATSALALEVDGVSVGATVASFADYRTDIAQFTYSVPVDDNLYTQWGMTFSGTCDPSFQAGYYVMLEPLSAGTHTIHFHAGAPGSPADPDAGVAAGDPFSLDVTYNLTVE
jgi:hypothetical protein